VNFSPLNPNDINSCNNWGGGGGAHGNLCTDSGRGRSTAKFKEPMPWTMGPGVASWLRRCTTSRTVPGSISGGVTGDLFRGSFRKNHVP
jgi:hypothetical protein